MKRKVIILAGWLIVWQLVNLWVGNDILMVGPLDTIEALFQNGLTVYFWKTIGCSVLRIATGFFAGTLLGFLLAVVSARFVLVEEIFSPVLSLIKAIPVASFVVLFLIWWRSNMLAVAISFFIVLPQIYISTLQGIHNVDKKLVEMTKVFEIAGIDKFLYVYRPALRPFLESGISIAAGMSWKSGVAAEVIGTPAFSVGERLYMSKIHLDTAGVFAWTVVIILASFLFEKMVKTLWNVFVSWNPDCIGAKKKKDRVCEKKTVVRVTDLSKTYGEQVVFQHVNAQYQAGETYYFTSPSGSGKTTYFRLLAQLEKPDTGEIERDLTGISMVFQEDRLCEEYSPIKNIELITGNREEAKKQLRKVLDEADLEKACKELSGGMKRRVALVRAFVADSDMLLLDEPFTGLDKETREKVSIFMKEEQKGRTILIASHINMHNAM